MTKLVAKFAYDSNNEDIRRAYDRLVEAKHALEMAEAEMMVVAAEHGLDELGLEVGERLDLPRNVVVTGASYSPPFHTIYALTEEVVS